METHRNSTTDQKRATSSILILIFGFVFGIFVASLISVPLAWGLFAVVLGAAIIGVEKILKNNLEKEVLFLALALVAFGLGSLRYSIKDSHTLVEPVLDGVVVSEPENRENATRFVMRSYNGEKVLVSTGLYSQVLYGDRVSVKGKLERPGIIEDKETGRSFDYGKYLSKDDIYYTLSFAKVEIVSSGNGNLVKQFLFKIKRSFVSKIREILAEPYASLLSGLIVSGRDALPKAIIDEFRRAGLVHIVVLSGYNITVIAEFMRKVFENLLQWSRVGARPRVAAWASIISILLFVLMTGAEATVVRASIMVLVVIVAKMHGQVYSASRALIVAGVLMLMFNPKILVFDASFQLSFLATLALIYLVPIAERYLKFIPDRIGLRTVISTTIATQMAVFPLLIYSMGNFSLVSLPANILVLVFIPITMLLGFTAAVLAYIHTIVALPLSYVSYLLLAYILKVSSLLGNLEFSLIQIPPIPAWSLVILYAVLITFVWRSRSSLQSSPSLN